MATLLSGVSANGAGSGASHSGPCTVMVHGDTVFDGARVALEVADTDTAADYVAIDGAELKKHDVLGVNVKGTYYLRAVVTGAGSSTSLNVVTTQ